jgi:hypothetical protein
VKIETHPASIGAIMGLLNTMGEKGEKSEATNRNPSTERRQERENGGEKPIPPTAATVTSPGALAERQRILIL